MTLGEKPQQGRAVILVTLTVLAALVSYKFIKLVITVIEPGVLQVPPMSSISVSAPLTAQPLATYDFTFDPFYRDEALAPITNIGADAPETTLNLKLFGRRFGPKGGAILQTPDGRQARYGIDDEIIEGVYLKAVYRDYIALEQGGRVERLTIQGSNEPSALLEPPVITSPGAIPTSRPSARANILTAVKLTRQSDQGQTIGFKVTPLNGSINLSDYGLQPGDIITRFGNVDLSQGQPSMSALMKYRNQREINLQVLRAGTLINVKVQP